MEPKISYIYNTKGIIFIKRKVKGGNLTLKEKSQKRFVPGVGGQTRGIGSFKT